MKSTKVQTLDAYYFARAYNVHVHMCNGEYAEVAQCMQLVDAKSYIACFMAFSLLLAFP